MLAEMPLGATWPSLTCGRAAGPRAFEAGLARARGTVCFDGIA